MTTTLKSNWMGNSNSAPIIFRAASKGKVFTRHERLAIIAKEHAKAKAKAKRLELILQERSKAKAEREQREAQMKALKAQLDNPTAKLKKSKNGFFVQGRDAKGGFLPKVAI
jgi:hypothetical protein